MTNKKQSSVEIDDVGLPLNSDKKKSILQFIKFAFVGALNTAIDFLVFTALVLIFGSTSSNPILTALFTFIAYACGVLNSFLFNSRWTFKREYKRTAREKLMFILVNAVTWFVSFALVWLLSNHVFGESGLASEIAEIVNMADAEGVEKVVNILSKLVAAPIVILVNFMGSKLFVFNQTR